VVKLGLIACFTVTSAVLTAGCSSGAGSPPASPAYNQTETFVRSSAEATRNLASAHVAVDIKGKFPRLGRVVHIDADVRVKQMMANGQATYDNGSVVPFVVADHTLSAKVGNQWSELGTTSAFVPPAMIDPSQAAQAVLENNTSLQSAGTETIDGVSTRKVTGNVPARQVEEILPDATKSAVFTAWIRDQGDPVLVRTTVSVSGEQAVTVSLSKWNVPVSLTPAPAA
jgi:lipoprotein LprG